MAGSITVRELTTVLNYRVDASGLNAYKKQIDSLARSIGVMGNRLETLGKSVRESTSGLAKSAS